MVKMEMLGLIFVQWTFTTRTTQTQQSDWAACIDAACMSDIRMLVSPDHSFHIYKVGGGARLNVCMIGVIVM